MKSDLSLLSELWSAIKSSVISTDRAQVTDTIVSVMVDHGYNSDDIRDAFRGDAEIVESLKYYATCAEDDEDDESMDDYEIDDDDDEWD